MTDRRTLLIRLDALERYLRYFDRDFFVTAVNKASLADAVAEAIALLTPVEPRILTMDEVHQLKAGESMWLEWRMLREDGSVAKGLEPWVVAPDDNAYGPDSYDYVKGLEQSDSEDMQDRYWSAKPTEEQRENTPWPKWKKEEWKG